MPVESERTDQRATAASGDVDVATRQRFESMLRVLCANSRNDVHLDLAELHFVDVGGVRALMHAAAELTPPATLVLHNAPAPLVRMLEMAWPDYANNGMRLS